MTVQLLGAALIVVLSLYVANTYAVAVDESRPPGRGAGDTGAGRFGTGHRRAGLCGRSHAAGGGSVSVAQRVPVRDARFRVVGDRSALRGVRRGQASRQAAALAGGGRRQAPGSVGAGFRGELAGRSSGVVRHALRRRPAGPPAADSHSPPRQRLDRHCDVAALVRTGGRVGPGFGGQAYRGPDAGPFARAAHLRFRRVLRALLAEDPHRPRFRTHGSCIPTDSA